MRHVLILQGYGCGTCLEWIPSSTRRFSAGMRKRRQIPSAELHMWLQGLLVIVTLGGIHLKRLPPADRCRHGGFVRLKRSANVVRALALLLGLGVTLSAAIPAEA